MKHIMTMLAITVSFLLSSAQAALVSNFFDGDVTILAGETHNPSGFINSFTIGDDWNITVEAGEEFHIDIFAAVADLRFTAYSDFDLIGPPLPGPPNSVLFLGQSFSYTLGVGTYSLLFTLADFSFQGDIVLADAIDFSTTALNVSAVPLPAAAWFFLTAIAGGSAVSRSRKLRA